MPTKKIQGVLENRLRNNCQLRTTQEPVDISKESVEFFVYGFRRLHGGKSLGSERFKQVMQRCFSCGRVHARHGNVPLRGGRDHVRDGRVHVRQMCAEAATTSEFVKTQSARIGPRLSAL